MEILDTLLHRRSIRSFTGGDIPRETVEALLVAGMSGPAGKGKKPWRFVVVKDAETISRLAQARDPKQKLFDTASLVIAVFGDPSIADTWVEDCSVARPWQLLGPGPHAHCRRRYALGRLCAPRARRTGRALS